jgi:hypothetical protein
MAKMVPAMLNMLKGSIAGGKKYDPNALQFRGQELYDRLYSVSSTPKLGGIVGGYASYLQKLAGFMGPAGGLLSGAIGLGSQALSYAMGHSTTSPPPGPATGAPMVNGQSTAGTSSGWANNGLVWRGTSPSGRGATYNQVATPDIMQNIKSSDQVTRGEAVAQALYNAGFRGQDLLNFLEISYRESRWTANKWNSGPVDQSGGILQENQLPWTKNHKIPPYTQADVLDPQAAAFIAHDMFMNKPPVNGPGGSPRYNPWFVNGSWKNGIPSEAAGLAQQALSKAHLGDVESSWLMPTPAASVAGNGGATYYFTNTFNMQGGTPSGVDAKRAAMTMADHLETEMRRRLARAS